MSLKKSLYFLFHFLLVSEIGYSQTYNFKNYNIEDGLPQSQVLAIYQDVKGYIWFGTNSGGVGKFDGNKFTHLTTDDGLLNNVVFSVTQNKKGHMFFGTVSGLSVYNNFSFKNFSKENGFNGGTIYKVFNFDEKIWLCTEKGVYTYQNDNITQFSSDTILNHSSVYCYFVDRNKNIWFGTLGNGIIFCNYKSNQFKYFTDKDGLMNNSIFSVSDMNDGTIYVGTQTGLNKIDNNFKVSEAKEIPGNENILYSGIVKAENNKYFFGTYNEGLMSFDYDEHKKSLFYSDNGLTNNSILSLLKDNEGNLWIGTDGAGVYKFYNNRFKYYLKLNGLPENYVSAVGIDKENNLWVANPGRGLTRISKREYSYYSTEQKSKNNIHDNSINTILTTKSGKLYFGTEEGMCYFENEKFVIVEDTSIRRKFIWTLYEDSKSNIWIGTTVGAFQLKGNKIAPVNLVNQFKPRGGDFMIVSITEDKNGKMWFGTDNGAISIEGDKVSRFKDEKIFVNTRVGTCISDKNGNLWFGTEKGLYFYNNTSFLKLGKEYNLPTTFINFLNIDQANRLIIGTNNGLDIINLDDFYANKKTVKHLGKDDGLLSLESNSNANAIDKDGKIYIGTVKGLEVYDPKQDVFNSKEPNINITNAKLFFGLENITDYSTEIDSGTTLPKNLILPYTKNNLTFQYVGISLIAPEKVMYRYKLLGLDSDWSPLVSKTEVTYPSLPPGKYSFVVKSMNSDGVWNKIPAIFSFEILPPWYKTWWFYTLSVITVLAILGSFYSYKTKKLLADKQKLENTVNERTKELREEKEKVEIINKEVIEQKAEIEHKNEEITDSIKYAKNIQEALLPSLEETERAFTDCFVLYQPKDIVSGDFFWFYQSNNVLYIAAADCTGHGVPGAFMSIVGNTLLNEIVSQKKITKPGDILLELHKGVKVALNHNQNESERRDGMDIALCAITKGSSKIEYSGANRPLWIYKKNDSYRLEIIKPTKFPIGGLELEEERVYVNHSISVEQGDYIYIFSDGFADQFGGPRGKKLMVSNMQKLIADNIDKKASLQKEKIKFAFDQWKKDVEQVDDVLVIGIKI